MDAGLIAQLSASLITLASVYFYGNKSKLGPVFGIVGEVPWLIVMIQGSLWGLLPINIAMFAMHIRNVRKTL